MADRRISTGTLTAIAEAIRAKTGGSDTYTPAQMAAAIAGIETGVLDAVYPPKCVHVARASVKCSVSCNMTMTLASAYAFTEGALKKSTAVTAIRNDGTHFGITAQFAVSNDTAGTAKSRSIYFANSSTSPRIDAATTSTLGEIGNFILRQNTEFIFTVYYSDADAFTGSGRPTKISFQSLVSCTPTAGTLTITEM